MKQKIQILPSGISLVDKAWGGLYRGGTYLLIGSRKSGRTTLALNFVKECLEQKEVCLFFTIRRPKDLILHAASINFDIQSAISQNQLVVIRVDSSINLRDTRDTDLIFSEYIEELASLVEKYQPGKLVFDEITPFLGFSDTDMLEESFTDTFESIEDLGATSLILLGDPVTAAAKKVVDILADHSTGILYLQSNDDEEDKLTSGTLIITPNAGHAEGKFKAAYNILPGKGFNFNMKNFTASKNYGNGHSLSTESKYKSLSDINVPRDDYQVSNLYSYEDFTLFVNNQIAYYKSTGQVFTIVSFKIDETSEKNGVVSINQVKNAVRLSIERKDKICVVSNKILVLLTKEDQKDITGLISKVKGNLLIADNSELSRLLSYIQVYALRVDETVQTAEDLLNELRFDELKGKNKLRL